MKNALLLIVLASLAGCNTVPPSGVRLSGTLEGHEGHVLEFTYLNEFINNDRVVLDLAPGEDGSFALAFDFGDPLTGTLRSGRTQITVYMEPGFDLRLKGDAGKLEETLVFDGRGSHPNNFLLACQRELEPRVGDRFIADQMRSLDPSAFAMLLDSVVTVKMNFLETWQESGDFSADFVHYFESQVLYDKYVKLLEYPALQQRLGQLPEMPVMPYGYFDFLDEPGTFDDTRLNSPAYVGFLMGYLDYYRQMTGHVIPDGQPVNVFSYNLAGEALEGASRDYLQAVFVSRELNYGDDLEAARALYRAYLEQGGTQAFKQAVTDAHEAISRLDPGQPAPDFTLTDIHGEPVSLSDFRGKVVYLDFWASWCGPCMREMPYFRELKVRLAEQEDLVFLYVSIDTDQQAWRNTVERNQITGVHLNTPGRERGVPALYHVKWIPSFFIIGRDGHIFDNRPPKPSDPEIDEVLLQALAREV
jgi:peroxiredoxin